MKSTLLTSAMRSTIRIRVRRSRNGTKNSDSKPPNPIPTTPHRPPRPLFPHFPLFSPRSSGGRWRRSPWCPCSAPGCRRRCSGSGRRRWVWGSTRTPCGSAARTTRRCATTACARGASSGTKPFPLLLHLWASGSSGPALPKPAA